MNSQSFETDDKRKNFLRDYKIMYRVRYNRVLNSFVNFQCKGFATWLVIQKFRSDWTLELAIEILKLNSKFLSKILLDLFRVNLKFLQLLFEYA